MVGSHYRRTRAQDQVFLGLPLAVAQEMESPKWHPGKKGAKDQNLRNPSCYMLSHTHICVSHGLHKLYSVKMAAWAPTPRASHVTGEAGEAATAHVTRGAVCTILDAEVHVAMGQNSVPKSSEHPNPTTKID